MLDLSPRVAKQRDDLDFNPALLLSSQWLIELDMFIPEKHSIMIRTIPQKASTVALTNNHLLLSLHREQPVHTPLNRLFMSREAQRNSNTSQIQDISLNGPPVWIRRAAILLPFRSLRSTLRASWTP